ncbi:hypothetical protein P167DRAFT_326366 [Morchella conica CCBAS932]|uniref:Uncharacterized protein n=1 Tax=Morchella conica CCBAS932 TaxID=1392247 RepID=A0A3N4KET5_9PEZI|nr:hypothetical protein P167DRAFT_326366 [Morchella conica CCBAS932]
MDPYMTMSLLRPTLWPDLIPHLRGKRLLILPGDCPAPAPTTPPAAATEEKQKRSQTSWTQYLTPKSTPTTPETTRVSVDASPARAHKLPPLPPPPAPPAAPMPPTPDTARTTAPEVFYTPETTRTAPELVPAPTSTNPRRTKAQPQQPPALAGAPPRGFRPLTRTESFLKPPEFGFDISLWCRFAPSYKPGRLMHVQFREITLQVVPSQPGGLDVGAFMNKAASAITNMVRRQGFLRMTSSFRELAVRPGALRMALEDWPSSEGGLGVGGETLRWVAEPVVLFCEVGDVEFVRDGGREDPRRAEEARRVEEARRLDDERREAEWRKEEARREAERREEGRRNEARREPKPMPMPMKKGRKVKKVQVESEEEVD